MKHLFKLLLTLLVFSTSLIAYESEKGKIDMHGGKGDALTKGNAFGMAMGIGTVLNKKGSDEVKKDDKKFIPLENKENIQKIEQIKGEK